MGLFRRSTTSVEAGPAQLPDIEAEFAACFREIHLIGGHMGRTRSKRRLAEYRESLQEYWQRLNDLRASLMITDLGIQRLMDYCTFQLGFDPAQEPAPLEEEHVLR